MKVNGRGITHSKTNRHRHEPCCPDVLISRPARRLSFVGWKCPPEPKAIEMYTPFPGGLATPTG